MQSDDALVTAFRNNPEGVGMPLSDGQKRAIYEGRTNHTENEKPYDTKKIVEGADVFFQNHPLAWLEKK